MQSELPSNASTQPLGTKRIQFKEPLPAKVSGKATTQPTQVTSPLEAALAAVQVYIATLHEKLQPFLKDLIGHVLKDASAFHHKSEKYTEMRANPEYVPTICQIVGIKLQALDEVTKSPGYKTLEDKLTKEIKALQCNWAT
jgi:hypothetical protein